jgi:hypothetical protein
MIDCVLFYGLLLRALYWLDLIGLGMWAPHPVSWGRPKGKPVKPITKHSNPPQLFPGLPRKALLRSLRARSRAPCSGTLSFATPPCCYARAPSRDWHLDPLLPESGLCGHGLGGTWYHPG